jgi:hypothetical protein
MVYRRRRLPCGTWTDGLDSPRHDGTPGSTRTASRAGPARASFGRFALVGGACTALHVLLLVLLAQGVATAMVRVTNFTLYRRWALRA